MKKSAPDPDGILHWVWKEHADIIAPVITAIWKLAQKKNT